MRILERNVYVGPSLYAHFPVIKLVLDLGALEAWPTGKLGPAYVDALVAALPGLAVTCLERVAPDDHSEAGTGLNVGPNAIKALRACDPALADEVIRIPLASPEIAGSLNLRGRIVTAIDLRRRLSLPAPRHTALRDWRVLVVAEHPLAACASETPRRSARAVCTSWKLMPMRSLFNSTA